MVSITTLVPSNSSIYDMYLAGVDVAQDTGPDLRQYKSGGNILKVRIVDSHHAEVSVFSESNADGNHRFITSYDEYAIGAAEKEISAGNWT